MDFAFFSMDDLIMKPLYIDIGLFEERNDFRDDDNYSISSQSFSDPDSDYIPDSDDSSNDSDY